MWFVIIGVVLLVLKFFDVSPVAGWDWWLLLPFVLRSPREQIYTSGPSNPWGTDIFNMSAYTCVVVRLNTWSFCGALRRGG